METSTLSKTVIFLCLVFSSPSTGSIIKLEGSPTIAKTDITKTLHLRCALRDSAGSPQGAVVGRDVSQTDYDVKQLSSLVMLRNGKEVAAITQTYTAKTLNDSNLQVTGSLNAGNGEKGYLDLTWRYPTEEQRGDYTCEANAIDDVGHNVVFSSALEIEVSDPSLVDLVKYIRQMEEEKEKEREMMRQTIERLNHTETGVFTCSSSNQWPREVIGNRDLDMTIQFQKPYDHPPHVKVGTISLDTYTDWNTRYSAAIVSVSETAFTVRCHTWDNTRIVFLGLSWISVP